MSQYVTIRINTSALRTLVVAAAAFLLALPLGATLFPRTIGVAEAEDNSNSVSAPVTQTAATDHSSIGSCTDPSTSNTSSAKSISALPKAATSSTSSTSWIHHHPAPSPSTHTSNTSNTTTTTNTSSNNSNGGARSGNGLVTAAIGTGDVLSDNNILNGNDIHVPVLSGNNTNVAPVTNVNPDINLLSGNRGILGLGILDIL